MTDNSQCLVREIIDAADGKIVGRIRLQKIVYLLEQLGLGGGFKFSYYHYGPYSEELAEAVERARFVDKAIDETTGYTGYGNPFSIYTACGPAEEPNTVGALESVPARKLIALMKAEQSVVIELAATIHWLQNNEKVADWKGELKRRKASKADEARIQRAERLLVSLGLREAA